MRQFRLLLWISSFLFTTGIFAQGNVQFDGFVSIGYLDPSDNRFFSDSNGEATILTENVLRLSAPFEDGLAVSGQVIYREAGDNYDGGLQLDFLQLDYRKQFLGDGEQTATLGRFKSRQGLYNETRDVPMTRPSILLPQSVYLDIARNFFLTLDGVKFASLHPFDQGDLNVEIAVGENRFDDKFSTMALGKTAEGHWDSHTNSYFDIRYESRVWTAAVNVAWVGLNYAPDDGAYLPVRLHQNLPAEFSVPTVAGEFNSVMKTYSLQYTALPVELTYEYSKRDFKSTGFAPGSPPSKLKMGGQYIQMRLLMNEDWTALIRFDEFYSNTDDKRGDSVAAGGNDRGYARSRDLVLGLTWQANKHWHAALEYHWITGGAWLPPIGKGSALPPLSDDWNITAFQLTYQF